MFFGKVTSREEGEDHEIFGLRAPVSFLKLAALVKLAYVFDILTATHFSNLSCLCILRTREMEPFYARR